MRLGDNHNYCPKSGTTSTTGYVDNPIGGDVGYLVIAFMIHASKSLQLPMLATGYFHWNNENCPL